MDNNRIKEFVRLAYKALEEKKASDITIIDISKLSVVADYFIIASADNIRQTTALCDKIVTFDLIIRQSSKDSII